MWIADAVQARNTQDMIPLKKRKLSAEEMPKQKTDQQDAVRYETQEDVTLTISQEAKEQKLKKQQEREAWLKQEQEQFQAMAEQEKESSEQRGEALKKQMKCLRIAMNIVSGDRVPPEDEAYLLKNDPELYNKSMSMRMPKKDPEECDSVLEDEDKEEMDPMKFPTGQTAELVIDSST